MSVIEDDYLTLVEREKVGRISRKAEPQELPWARAQIEKEKRRQVVIRRIGEHWRTTRAMDGTLEGLLDELANLE